MTAPAVDIYNDPQWRERATTLTRWSKTRLAERWHQLHPHAWTAHPVHQWDKQEIAWDIVRAEVAEAAATELLNTLGVGDEVTIGAFPDVVFRVVEVRKPARAIRVVGPVDTPSWINVAAVRRATPEEMRGEQS